MNGYADDADWTDERRILKAALVLRFFYGAGLRGITRIIS